MGDFDPDDEPLAQRVRRMHPELVIPPPPPAAAHTGDSAGAKRKGGGGDEPGAKKPRAPEAKAKKPAGSGKPADGAKQAKKRNAADDDEAEMQAMMVPKKGVRRPLPRHSAWLRSFGYPG